MKRRMRIITFGTFDLFHSGHYNILRACKEYGNEKNTVIVGISSDELNRKKGKQTYESYQKRCENVRNTCFVDEIFLEEELEKKKEYVEKYRAELLIMGSDWKYKFDWIGIPTVYLPRTTGISSTRKKLEETKEKYYFAFLGSIEEEHQTAFKILEGCIEKYSCRVEEYSHENHSKYHALLCFHPPEKEYKDLPVFLIDVDCTLERKIWKEKEILKRVDHFLLSGPSMKRYVDLELNRPKNTYSTAYIYSEELIQVEKEKEGKNILFVSSETCDVQIPENKEIIFLSNTSEAKKYFPTTCLLISDCSSLLIDASVVEIPTIQIGDSSFVGGIICNDLQKLSSMIENILDMKEEIQETYRIIRKNILDYVNILDNPEEVILYRLLTILKERGKNNEIEILQTFEDYYNSEKNSPSNSNKKCMILYGKETDHLLDFLIFHQKREIVGISIQDEIDIYRYSSLLSYQIQICYDNKKR